LTLPDDFVSSRHAYLQKIFGRVVCVDLASSNGTYWPEGRRPFGWFDEEHPISIGKYRLRLASPSPEEELAEPEFDPGSFFKTDSERPEVPKVSLQYLSDSGDEESWTLSRTITLVGASTCCKLRLQHPSVSRVHCSLILLPEGLWVVDLLGNEGTLVNDERIRSVRLADGDVFQIGKYAFRVTYLPPETASDGSNALMHDRALAGKVVSNEFAGQLIDQVMAMQQQFLQQSQQQTEMMLQFFSTMHTQQHELLSQEMARVREIDKELRELRGSLTPTAPTTANQQVAESSEADTEARVESATEDLPRLKHIRTAGPPVTQTATEMNREDADLEVTQTAPPDQEQAEPELVADAVQSSPADTLDDERAAETAEDPTVSIEVFENQPDETADGMNPTEFSEESLPEEVCKTDEEVEPKSIEDESDQVTTQNEIDHHAWVLSRMHQLERERDGIFRKMVKSIFRSS
jgi:pSer/pThr/pTyr-binding forkhead associated (FHA) protein